MSEEGAVPTITATAPATAADEAAAGTHQPAVVAEGGGDGEAQQQHQPSSIDQHEEQQQQEEEEEEEHTIEEQLEIERDKTVQLKETITGLIAQITSYREMVEEEKESDCKKISKLEKLLDEAKGQNLAYEETIGQLEQREAETRKKNIEQLKQFQSEMIKLKETEDAMNKALLEERAAHNMTIKQLNALKERLQTPWAQESQEVRFKLTFDSGKVSGVEMIPENDAARAELKEQNDLLLSKFLEAQQKANLAAGESEKKHRGSACIWKRMPRKSQLNWLLRGKIRQPNSRKQNRE